MPAKEQRKSNPIRILTLTFVDQQVASSAYTFTGLGLRFCSVDIVSIST
jgi:hypothetical protein